MSQKTVVVLGATGLVGSELCRQLEEDEACERIIALTRRPVQHAGAKLRNHVVDFETPEEWRELVRGDALVSCMGTTLRRAGSQSAQRRVDFDYQLKTAEMARENDVRSMVLVSSTGARSDSRLFYSRMKGELDERMETLGFPSLTILRPGPLAGERQEKRPGERVLLATLRSVPSGLLPSSARPIQGQLVAKAAILALSSELPGTQIWEARDLFRRTSV